MPFPLAHPAAVLPLRRYCPRYLSFPALVVGSLSPDLGYCFGQRHVDSFSHRFLAGSFLFCLPAGLLVLFGFYLLRRPLISLLPARLRQALSPLCNRPAGAPVAVVISLLLGAWTHIFLDDISYPDGQVMAHLPILQGCVLSIGAHRFGVPDLLYAVCTFGGVAWLTLLYLEWRETAAGSSRCIGTGLKWTCALLLAGSILFVATASRGNNHLLGMTGLAVSSLLLLIGFLVGAELLMAGRLKAQAPNP